MLPKSEWPDFKRPSKVPDFKRPSKIPDSKRASKFRHFEKSSAQIAFAEFVKAEGQSILRVWHQGLDPDCHSRVTKYAFVRYLREAKYPEDPHELFQELDDNLTNEISLFDICPEACALWSSFRRWCCQEFPAGAQAMLVSLAEVEDANDLKVSDLRLTQKQFCDALVRAGWDNCHEELFLSLSHDQRWLILADLKWFDIEISRWQRRMRAKGKAQEEKKLEEKKKTRDREDTLAEFKDFLKEKYGGLIRAWRTCLVPTDVMQMHKSQFLRACAELGWKTGTKGLWNAMDKDSSGVIGIDEFDFQQAEALAFFADFAVQKFETVHNLFQAIDYKGRNFVREEEFTRQLQKLGFSRATPNLFDMLDKERKKRIVVSDLEFLFRWKVPGFLLAEPSPKAVDDMKAVMKKKHGSYLRAWRSFDKDGSNKCTWDEFKEGCKNMCWEDDPAGAWRALDSTSRGYISLVDIDPDVSQLLGLFRNWSRETFGSVKSMFQVFDVDGSRSLTMKEFIKSCMVYDFHGDPKLIYIALGGMPSDDDLLLMNDVIFLDQYGITEKPELERVSVQETQEDKKQLAPSIDVADSYKVEDWADGALHPAFRSWANSRRRRPVTKTDGSVPRLASQLDLGSPHAFRRPMLLLAYVPPTARQQPSQSARESRARERFKLPQVIRTRAHSHSERGIKPAEKAEVNSAMLE